MVLVLVNELFDLVYCFVEIGFVVFVGLWCFDWFVEFEDCYYLKCGMVDFGGIENGYWKQCGFECLFYDGMDYGVVGIVVIEFRINELYKVVVYFDID